MPNYVDNLVTVKGLDAQKVLALVKSDKTSFDFNKVVRMPPELADSTASTDADWGLLLLDVPYPESRRVITVTSVLKYALGQGSRRYRRGWLAGTAPPRSKSRRV